MPPGINGLEAAVKIREIDARLPIGIVTAYTDIQTIDLAKEITPAVRLFVLQKPFHTTELQQLVIALNASWELERASNPETTSPDPAPLPPLEQLMRNRQGPAQIFDRKQS